MNGVSRSAVARPIFFLLVSVMTLGGGFTAHAGEAEVFCSTLQEVNSGGVDTSGLPDLAGHAKVVDTLVSVASDEALRSDLIQLRETFSAWASAVDGEVPMQQTFAILRDPELAGVQGRIADYVAQECGIRLGDGRYHVGTDASRKGRCAAWPSVGNPLTFNHFPNLPDTSGGNYFAQRFWILEAGDPPPGMFGVEPGGRVRIRGQYPQARYFAFHPNDEDLNNLQTLRDRDLDPDPGSVNPFREEPTKGDANFYTAWLVFDQPPSEPAPNTYYVGAKKDGIKPTQWVWNMLRLYASDLGNGPNSGGVPLPAVTIYDREGEVVQHFDECEPFEPGESHPETDILFPALPIADHRAENPPTWSTSSNFDSPSDTLANADVQYLLTTFSRRFGDIMVIRARQLKTPNTREGEPVSDPTQDIRLFTLCTYNIWSGSARQCLLDQDLLVDQEGFYTLVIADEEHRPANLESEQATSIDWGPYLDGQLTWRMVYRENPFARRIAFALNGGYVPDAMRDYVPMAIPCTKARFEEAGWQGCLSDFEQGSVASNDP
ncbi:MAG: hypothetical protein ACJZ7Z_04155 [Myxococcota bacterium]